MALVKVTGYRLDSPGLIPDRSWDFSLLYSVQSISYVHPASYTMGTMVFFPGVKRLGCKVDPSSSSSTEVKNGGATSPVPNTSTWRGA
jgi:hypothetical protein